MTVTLYLDVFFLVNFGMDYLLLSLVKRLLHLSVSRWRVGLSALMGGIWACISLMVPGLSGWTGFFLTWLGVGGGMVILAFGTRSGFSIQEKRKGRIQAPELYHIRRCLVTFWMVSVMIGGIFGLLGDPVPAGYYLWGMGENRYRKLLPLCLLAAGGYFAVLGGQKLIEKRGGEHGVLYQVRLCYRGKEQMVTALWDTGNQLYEPYGGEPVHIVTKRVSLALCRTVPQLIYIPFRTVGSEYKMMPGIRIDSMEVEREGEKLRHYDRPWLAISKRPLSLENRYEMLLHGSWKQ